MSIEIKNFTVSTNGFDDLIDITQKIENIVSFVSPKEALVSVSVNSSCASIILIEDIKGIKSDLALLLDNIAPLDKMYKKEISWSRDDSYSYLKAALFKNSVCVQVVNSRLQLDAGHKIALVDFDIKPRIRQIGVCIVY